MPKHLSIKTTESKVAFVHTERGCVHLVWFTVPIIMIIIVTYTVCFGLHPPDLSQGPPILKVSGSSPSCYQTLLSKVIYKEWRNAIKAQVTEEIIGSVQQNEFYRESASWIQMEDFLLRQQLVACCVVGKTQRKTLFIETALFEEERQADGVILKHSSCEATTAVSRIGLRQASDCSVSVCTYHTVCRTVNTGLGWGLNG